MKAADPAACQGAVLLIINTLIERKVIDYSDVLNVKVADIFKVIEKVSLELEKKNSGLNEFLCYKNVFFV